MRPIRLASTLAALALLAACTSDPSAPITASGRPAFTGGYMSSGNAFEPDTNGAPAPAADTVTARGPGYMGSGY